MRQSVAVIIIPLMALGAGAASWKSELEGLVRTERHFAKTSVAKGVKEAFLAFLADDGVLFRPGPVPGRKWISENAPKTGTLDWQPVHADLAAAGDLGYTTGPYEFRGEQGSRFGHYVTVWKKQANGTWRFVVDLGIAHPKPDPAPAEAFPTRHPSRALSPGDAAKERSVLLESDDEFSTTAAERGVATAYAAWTTTDVRVYRANSLPALGRREMGDLLAARPGRMTWRPERADVSRSGDLGYTWGSYELTPPGEDAKAQKGFYLRIWKREPRDSWKVALDILN